MQTDLHDRIHSLEQSFDQLAGQFTQAFNYSSSDPQASLNKVRIILEKIVKRVYAIEVGETPDELMIGAALRNPVLNRSIERRIFSKINAIRSMTNLAVHGEFVTARDAFHSMDNLCDVMEWYINKYENGHVSFTQKKKWSKWKGIMFVLIPIVLITLGIRYFINDQHSNSEVKKEIPQTSSVDIVDFVHDFEESINQDDLDKILKFYADEVIYYGKRVPKRPNILEDKKSFIKRWSNRNYFVSSPIKIIESDGRIYELKYDVSYHATDNSRKADSKGTWEASLKLRKNQDNTFEVIEIHGKQE